MIEGRIRGIHAFTWDWKEITEDVRKEYNLCQDLPKLKSNEPSEYNITMKEKEAPQIVLKLSKNKSRGEKN